MTPVMPMPSTPTSQKPTEPKKAYNPSQEEKQRLLDLVDYIDRLQRYRSTLKANPYDKTGKSRTIEATWDYCDYVSLPHKYSHPEMRDWMADSSVPIVMAKMDTALSILVSKNPEVELTARQKKWELKTKILTNLYDCSWDKGHGRQQLIKFIFGGLKYGFQPAREYHRYFSEEREELVGYDPETMKRTYEKKHKVIHDEAYLECLPIRDCWFDWRAKPYDEDSIRGWMWKVEYDKSTYDKEYPVTKYPNAPYVIPSQSSVTDTYANKDLLKETDNVDVDKITLYFVENKENNTFQITDKSVMLYEGKLMNGELSCVTWMWRIRHEGTIYGLSLPEILENDSEIIDRMQNMIINQSILSISGAGYYGGVGNLKEDDMILEPKLKKLRDSDKINFPSIPPPNSISLNVLERLGDQVDEISGITKSLTGEQIGKTLGEAVLNKEAGLKRLSLPLENIEFALERHARLRIDNLQRIYGRPISTQVIRTNIGQIVDEKLWQEYLDEKARLGSDSENMTYRFPEAEDGTLYRNNFQSQRISAEALPMQDGIPATEDQYLEITPAEIDGEYDIKIRAFSTIPMSKTLEEARALETFNIVAKLPYTDIYKAEKWLLEKRGTDPDELMVPEEQVIETQQTAEENRQAVPVEGEEQPGQPGEQPGGNAGMVVPPQELEQPAARGGMAAQFSNAVRL